MTLTPSKSVDPKTIVEFHVGDSLVRLHGVAYRADSVTGIPWLDHLSCNTCRVSYALASVRDVRTGHPGAGAYNIAVPVGVFLLGLLGVAMQLANQGGS